MFVAFMLPAALAGYGEVVDGQPTWAQRELHVYTNMVRVDPMAWDYACNSQGWKSTEKTAKEPLFYHSGLTEIAQIHSEDMERYRFMDHDSSDGTPFDVRVWPYYEGNTIGENVAYGYSNNESALFDGWMCSDGHRANIMSGSFDHLGAGVEGTYYTQDFGGGANQIHQPVAMGVHTPERPSGNVTFYATWSDSAAPDFFAVETDGACLDMERDAGTASRGAWSVRSDVSGLSASGEAASCRAYRFVFTRADGTEGALPASGSYQFGVGCDAWIAETPAACDTSTSSGADGDDDAADCGELDFVDRNGDCLPDPVGGEDGDVAAGGCSAVGAAGFAGVWWLALAAVGARRRD